MNHYKRNGLLERQSAPLNPYDLAVIAEAFNITVQEAIDTALHVQWSDDEWDDYYDRMGLIKAPIMTE